jgi:hypothetical protein
MANDVYDSLKEHMSGHEEKPAKVLHHIRTRKAGKGYIHEHHFTHPTHNTEEHTSPDQDGMVDHMLTHLGNENPGEAEADAGQSGIPPAAQTPLAAATGGAQTA